MALGKSKNDKQARNNHKMVFRSFATPDKPIVYVIHGARGDMLIDCAYTPHTKHLISWIENEGFNLRWVFLTHGHFDHSCNAAALQEHFGAKIIIHEKDESYLRNAGMRKLYPSLEKHRAICSAANAIASRMQVPRCEADICLGDNDTGYLREIGFNADIVMLPGHTLGSMGVLEGKVLYCGDACSAKRGDYYTAMFGEDVDAIRDSEKKIFDINPLIIAPGHGHIIINERAFD